MQWGKISAVMWVDREGRNTASAISITNIFNLIDRRRWKYISCHEKIVSITRYISIRFTIFYIINVLRVTSVTDSFRNIFNWKRNFRPRIGPLELTLLYRYLQFRYLKILRRIDKKPLSYFPR